MQLSLHHLSGERVSCPLYFFVGRGDSLRVTMGRLHADREILLERERYDGTMMNLFFHHIIFSDPPDYS